MINIDMGETSGMNELKDALARMAQQQQTLINAGVSTKEIAAQDIVDVTPKENQ